MKLKIENVAKIEHAEMEMNGITVIAGNNNTGKSTIGKVVFSLFNSLVDIEDRLERQKEQMIYKQLKYRIDDINRGEKELNLSPVLPGRLRNYARELCRCDEGEEQQQIIRRFFKTIIRHEWPNVENAVLEVEADISEIKNLSMDRLTKSVVSAISWERSEYFKNGFAHRGALLRES